MAKIISEPVTVGDTTFVKDSEKGWIDLKSKKPVDPGGLLVKILDSLDVKLDAAAPKKEIDPRIEPIKLGNSTYVFDKNMGWIDKKTGQPVPPKMQESFGQFKTERVKKSDTSSREGVARAATGSIGIMSRSNLENQLKMEGNSQADIQALSNSLSSTLAIIKNVNGVLSSIVALDRFKNKESIRVEKEISREGGSAISSGSLGTFGSFGAVSAEEDEEQQSGGLLSGLLGLAGIAAALGVATFTPGKGDDEETPADATSSGGGRGAPAMAATPPEATQVAPTGGRGAVRVEVTKETEETTIASFGEKQAPRQKTPTEEKTDKDEKKTEEVERKTTEPMSRMEQYAIATAQTAAAFAFPSAFLMSKVDSWKKAFRETLSSISNALGFGGDSYGGGGGGDIPGLTGNAQTALAFFMSPQGGGYTLQQAAGIIGNLQAESGANLDHTADTGDGGNAYGIAQWNRVASPDRVANFERYMGVPLRGSSFRKQLEFITWELRNTENRADVRLRATTTAADAAAVFDQYYERSDGTARARRIEYANAIAMLQLAPSSSTSMTGGVGTISSNYGMRRHPITGRMRMHAGIDIRGISQGTPIYAAMAGTIALAGRAGGYGNAVYINHADGSSTRYAHLHSIAPGITRGARVAQGAKLGGAGTTGLSTGVHLHFEIRNRAGEPINPATFYRANSWIVGGTPGTMPGATSMQPPQANNPVPAPSLARAFPRPTPAPTPPPSPPSPRPPRNLPERNDSFVSNVSNGLSRFFSYFNIEE